MDDILLINPNYRHEIQSSKDSLYAEISFTYSLVADIFDKDNVVFICDSAKEPELREIKPNHHVACHYAEKFVK